MAQNRDYSKDLRDCLKLWDENGDGKICKHMLRGLLIPAGVSAEEFDLVFANVKESSAF